MKELESQMKLMSTLIAAVFAAVSFSAVAADIANPENSGPAAAAAAHADKTAAKPAKKAEAKKATKHSSKKTAKPAAK